MEQASANTTAKASYVFSSKLDSVSPKLFIEFYLMLHPDTTQGDLAAKFGMTPQAFSKLLARPTGTFNNEQKQLMADLVSRTDFSGLERETTAFFDTIRSLQFLMKSEHILPLLLQLHADYYPEYSFILSFRNSVLDFQDLKKQARRLYYFDNGLASIQYIQSVKHNPLFLRAEDVLCTNNKSIAYSDRPRLDFVDGHMYPDQVILFSENYDKIIEFFNC